MKEENKTPDLPLGLYWKDKRTTVDRTVLPFQNLEVIETINESRATREAEKGDMFRKDPEAVDTSWRNKLIWGDNKYAMAALLEKYAGKIDLIYIDPPFATGADFSSTFTIGEKEEIEIEKEASAIEEVVYRDTWGEGYDSFIQMLYERLLLMRELLSEKGSIYVHLDWRTNSYIKLVLDEIFGLNNFRNSIIWHYGGRMMHNVSQYNRKHDVILFYSKKENGFIFELPKDEVDFEQYAKTRHEKIHTDEDGKRYLLAPDATMDRTIRQYEEDILAKGRAIDDVWEIRYIRGNAKERTGYPTQKPEELLDRIIRASTRKGSLVADFFCGSGTTGAVAEKLGRRWIMSDLGRFSIHTTRKRLLEISGCKPFEVLNIGKYERQYWQSSIFGRKTKEQTLAEYIEFILKLYKANPIPGSTHIHGQRNKELVHVGSVEAPVTLNDIENATDETQRMKQKSLTILGWEWEMGLHDVVEKYAKKAGVKLKLLSIPREVMDKRATDAGEIAFYELAYLETEVIKDKQGYGHIIKLTDFVIPNMELVPQEVREKIKKWSDYIDYWSVDWKYEGDTFHNMWQAYRTKKDRKLVLETDPYDYKKKGKHQIMVKVIDIFGNDTTQLIDLKVD